MLTYSSSTGSGCKWRQIEFASTRVYKFTPRVRFSKLPTSYRTKIILFVRYSLTEVQFPLVFELKLKTDSAQRSSNKCKKYLQKTTKKNGNILNAI